MINIGVRGYVVSDEVWVGVRAKPVGIVDQSYKRRFQIRAVGTRKAGRKWSCSRPGCRVTPTHYVRGVVGATVVGVLRARTLVFSEADAPVIWTVDVVPTRRVADALVVGDDPVALESAFELAATEASKLVIADRLVALEVAPAPVVAEAAPLSVDAGERPRCPAAPFLRPGRTGGADGCRHPAPYRDGLDHLGAAVAWLSLAKPAISRYRTPPRPRTVPPRPELAHFGWQFCSRAPTFRD